MNLEEKIIGKNEVFKGNIIDVNVYSVLLPNGKEATRDVVLHPGACAVVPINSKGEIYLVRQYRAPIEQIMLEIPAGKLDKGENPDVCAARELKEETGLVAGNLKKAFSIHTAPGFSNEIIHIYIATELKEEESCTDEDEFISFERLPVDKLLEMIFNQEITDTKTIVGVFLADRFIRGQLKL